MFYLQILQTCLVTRPIVTPMHRSFRGRKYCQPSRAET